MARALNYAFLAVLVLVSMGLLWLGGRLLLLGGSPFYVLAGLALAATAFLAARKSPKTLPIYGAFFALTLIWALWESGFDGWALAPRVVMFALFGLWMMTPWFRAFLGLRRDFAFSKFAWPGLGVLMAGAVALLFWIDQPDGARGALDEAYRPAQTSDGEWRNYGNDPGGSRYSPLAQITPANVRGLEPIWTYHTGPAPDGQVPPFQATPLMIGGTLYFCTGYNDVIALDAATGAEKWRFRPNVDPEGVYGRTCRGVAYHELPRARGACAQRIYTATIDARLIALDAQTGAPCTDFGEDGQVDLRQGMGDFEKGYYFVTSPPQIARGRVVLGGWVTDGQMVGEPSGVIRAFDARTGAFSWAFDIGRPDQHGLPRAGETFTRGTPNSWAPMSADEGLGLVYAPTGNATPDYVGMHRTANDELYSSSVVALDAESGAVRWSFQTTHHDLWDYDAPAQPTLIDLPNGVKGLLQATKRGEIFFLDRRTGEPIAAVEEIPVPQGGVEGERLSPTQPFSTGLPSFEGQRPTEARMWGLTPLDQAYCRILFREARFEGSMTPLGVDRHTITWPGFLGGVDWGGVSVDPARGLMIVNANHVGNHNRLMTREEADSMGLKPMTASHVSNVGGPVAQQGTPYAAHIRPFLSPLAVPCQQPPYGTLNAVNLHTGELVWSERFGASRDSGPLALPSFLPIPIGTPNLGGSVITASGLVFIGATQEHYLRAYDLSSGRELWKARLPAGGQATPMTFWSTPINRQVVVIAAGGHAAMLSGSSDALIAYALP